MNILLTGANGFIGRAIRSSFSHRILSLFKNAHYLRNENDFYINLADKKQISNLAKDLLEVKVDAIIHTAAITPFSSTKEPQYELDIRMAENISTLAQLLNIKTMLFTSGWNIYNPSNDVPFKEDSRLKPNTNYGISKLRVETFFKENLKNTHIINVRLASIYGPGQISRGLIPNAVRSALQSHTILINSPTTKRDYVYISDVTTAIKQLLSLKQSKSMDINIGSGFSYSVKTVAETIQQIMNTEYNVNIAIHTEQIDSKSIPSDNQLDITRAKKLINFRPSTTLVDGLKNYISWVQQTN